MCTKICSQIVAFLPIKMVLLFIKKRVYRGVKYGEDQLMAVKEEQED